MELDEKKPGLCPVISSAEKAVVCARERCEWWFVSPLGLAFGAMCAVKTLGGISHNLMTVEDQLEKIAQAPRRTP